MKRNLGEELAAKRVLIVDGAMGTMLYSKGVYINRCFEELNLSQGAMVREVHREYLEAGADILMTNTYGANRLKLAAHGLENQVTAINKAAVDLCRSVAGDKAWVAGSIGPLKRGMQVDGITEAEAKAVFDEHASGLAAGGIDLMILETFTDHNELRIALEAVKRKAPGIPIAAFMSFGVDGTTLKGLRPEEVAAHMAGLGADIVGANCSTGPHAMFDTMQRMCKSTSIPVGAMPNAGAPRVVDGRTMYMATPDYMSKFAKRYIVAGVQLIGGCCGTTPAMIHEVAMSVKALSPSRIKVVAPQAAEADKPLDPVPREKLSPFAAKLSRGEFAVSIEVRPPKGLNADAMLKSLKKFREMGVDTVNIPDSPRATVSMSPMALAALIKRSAGLEAIVHFSCRDRNLLGMQSDLLGLHALDVRDVLIVTGDPPHMGNYPHATAVFDLDAIGLTSMVANLNRGLDLAGKSLGSVTGFHHGVGADPGAVDFDREVNRYIEKVESGAMYMMTQPVFDVTILEKFMKAVKSHRVKTLVGIMPFISHRNCEFFHHEVPGVVVPAHIREIMREAGSGPKAMREGVAIAREALDAARSLCDGAYIMAPMGKYNLPLAVLGHVPPEEIA
ncbi:MAG: bifunctional homocysteine S-methyltransferase/methylenetetrahydrofolate reductase [Planctomycetota bacterium]